MPVRRVTKDDVTQEQWRDIELVRARNGTVEAREKEEDERVAIRRAVCMVRSGDTVNQKEKINNRNSS